MGRQKDILISRLREGSDLSRRDQLRLTFLLATPAILSQLSMCLMSVIDAAMVGRLGSAPAAAIGLVSSTTWLFGSICYSNNSGFSVQIAHRCGDRDYQSAKRVFRYGFWTLFAFSIVLGALGALLSGALPHWLGGGEDIISDSASYFLIYSLFMPAFQLAVFAESVLIASGNTKVPSIASLMMCGLDVVFNYIFIFILGMGVKGAALGTGIAEVCAGGFLVIYALRNSPELKQKFEFPVPARKIPGLRTAGNYRATIKENPHLSGIFGKALSITAPLWLQSVISRGAFILATALVAQLGTLAIAANSFAIIIEGFCYLPGYGMQDAATSLVGQSLGAGRPSLARRFAKLTIWSGAGIMAFCAALMWIFAPQGMALVSRDPEVIALGARCLRIEVWAEIFFAVSIVGTGCCIGAGDSLFPSIANLASMWVIRICLALLLIPRFGLEGYWVAMATETVAKGLIFAFRIRGSRWIEKYVKVS